MRILTLNLRAGGGPRIPGLVEAIGAQGADVVVLTEFRLGASGTQLLELLASQGYAQVLHSSPPPRTNSALIVSRAPGNPEAVPAPHHRIVGVRFEEVSIHGVYLPLNLSKVEFWDDHLASAIAAVHEGSAILIGDFNTGMPDERQSRVRFFAEDRFAALLDAGWVDAVRSRRMGAPEFSWFSHAKNGFTIDHALVSPSLAHRITDARLLHELRLLGLTDHSGLVLDID